VGRLRGVVGSFAFKPETDGELALLIANESVLKRINPGYVLLDYNDQAPFDCIIYDSTRREFISCELEPTLIEFLQQHIVSDDLRLIVTWSLGKWRMGARKKGLRAGYALTEPTPTKKGHYRLLGYARESSKKPFADYEVVVLEDLFQVQE
jgi:hypothetical protein